jgi:hypothetical protein
LCSVVSNRPVRRERPCRGAADERDALTVSIDRIALGSLPVRARMQDIELAVVSQGCPGLFTTAGKAGLMQCNNTLHDLNGLVWRATPPAAISNRFE